jgi:hypothetical protein
MPHSSEEDPQRRAQYWAEELEWLQDAIDRRTDVIYVWSVVDGTMVRSAIGAEE